MKYLHSRSVFPFALSLSLSLFPSNSAALPFTPTLTIFSAANESRNSLRFHRRRIFHEKRQHRLEFGGVHFPLEYGRCVYFWMSTWVCIVHTHIRCVYSILFFFVLSCSNARIQKFKKYKFKNSRWHKMTSTCHLCLYYHVLGCVHIYIYTHSSVWHDYDCMIRAKYMMIQIYVYMYICTQLWSELSTWWYRYMCICTYVHS